MSKTLISQVRDLFVAAVSQAFPAASSSGVAVKATSELKFGDYQFNSAMAIFKELKDSGNAGAVKSPRDVAVKIQQCLPASAIISKTEIAGPGFVNIFLNPGWIAGQVQGINANGVVPLLVESKRVIVDFSSPNIAKEMHVGHLRSTIIGDCICRVLEFVGHRVDRVNHVGDWGTQFGMLITHLRDTSPQFMEAEANISDLTAFYKQSKKRFDDDPAFKKASQEEVPRLQSGDATSLAAWAKLCEVSRVEFAKVYERLDIRGLVEVGESFYNSRIPAAIAMCEAAGIVTQETDARGTCKIIKIEDEAVPLMVQKSDGGFGYDSTDLAAIHYRFVEKNADWVVYVTDSGQWGHFRLVFKAAQRMGWIPAHKRVDHVGFGLVLGADGKKFKTRANEVVRLFELLDEAMLRAKASIFEKRQAESKDEEGGVAALSLEDAESVERIARSVGYGAVKYADLKTTRIMDYTFDFDRMLDFKGNTAVYLLYAYARIQSIFRKAGVAPDSLNAVTPALDHPAGLNSMLFCPPPPPLYSLTPLQRLHLPSNCSRFMTFWRALWRTSCLTPSVNISTPLQRSSLIFFETAKLLATPSRGNRRSVFSCSC
jgi:arginyl-tRNA synthetase